LAETSSPAGCWWTALDPGRQLRRTEEAIPAAKPKTILGVPVMMAIAGVLLAAVAVIAELAVVLFAM
jgi:hypothetical protein